MSERHDDGEQGGGGCGVFVGLRMKRRDDEGDEMGKGCCWVVLLALL